MRAVALSAVKAGITRLRQKGGASPESLYDLLNGYVTAARSIQIRPGSAIEHQLPEGTKGLVLFRGKFVVFADHLLDPGDPGYEVQILTHPEANSSATLVDIRVAVPFLRYLYVVALWSDGRKPHYWLQAAEPWQPDHVYLEGAVVQPSVPDGFTYRATRLKPAAALWEANVEREVGDVVEPTTPNGYDYTVIDVLGAKPRSGATEPDWNEGAGAITYEDADNTAAQPPAPEGGGGAPTLPPDVTDRYGNRFNGGQKVLER